MKNGGCALGYQNDINKAAFLASFEESFIELGKALPEHFADPSTFSDSTTQPCTTIATYIRIKREVGGLSSEWHSKLLRKRNLQHGYSEILDSKRKEAWIADIKEFHEDSDLVRAINLANVESSAWMTALPTSSHMVSLTPR